MLAAAESIRTRTTADAGAGVGFESVAPAPVSTKSPRRCLEQRPQAFLLRAGQLAKPRASAAERQRIEAARARSIDYRTRCYGKFPGFGHHRDNEHPPRFYARLTHFMGLPVLVHEKVVPALTCVEEALARDCSGSSYRPMHLGGLRDHNTYADYEISNHVYGIAIDIDPHKNPCCGCLGRWSRHPGCGTGSPVWERMAMPECWVRVFERYGFHWLGHDELEDTMHFEFLGDADHILG